MNAIVETPSTEPSASLVEGGLPATPAAGDPDWSSLGLEFSQEERHYDLEGPSSEPKPASEPSVAETEPKPAAALVEAPPAASPAAPAATETPLAAAAAPEAKPAERAPSAPAVDMQAWMAEQQAALEKEYALTEDDQLLADTEPAKILPKLLAQVHLNTMTSVMSALQAALPNMLQQHQTQTSSYQQFGQQFVSAWPEIGKLMESSAEGRQEVLDTVRAVRSVYPHAKPEELIQTAGVLISQKKGLPLTSQGKGVSAPQASNSLTSANIPPAPGAASSAQGGLRIEPLADNPWGALAESFMIE